MQPAPRANGLPPVPVQQSDVPADVPAINVTPVAAQAESETQADASAPPRMVSVPEKAGRCVGLMEARSECHEFIDRALEESAHARLALKAPRGASQGSKARHLERSSAHRHLGDAIVTAVLASSSRLLRSRDSDVEAPAQEPQPPDRCETLVKTALDALMNAVLISLYGVPFFVLFIVYAAAGPSYESAWQDIMLENMVSQVFSAPVFALVFVGFSLHLSILPYAGKSCRRVLASRSLPLSRRAVAP